jgi:hypothetical protein
VDAEGDTEKQERGNNSNITPPNLVRQFKLSGMRRACYVARMDFFPGVKGAGSEANHSPLSSSKAKNLWSYNSIPPYIFMA